MRMFSYSVLSKAYFFRSGLRQYIVASSLVLACLVTHKAFSEQQFQSSVAQTQLIELYTSEGCSSCPPADRWLSRYKDSPTLWRSVIPVAFHVDYWDDLGWPDRFASPEFTARQRQHRRQQNIRSVYTPGFVVNGSEWKGWWANRQPPTTTLKPGILSLGIADQSFTANFAAQQDINTVPNLTVAIVAFSLKTPVPAGENKGELLNHDFVVVGMEHYQSDDHQWQGSLPQISEEISSAELGVVAWLSGPGSLKPIQAVGGLLTP